jgi:hypothetical protein
MRRRSRSSRTFSFEELEKRFGHYAYRPHFPFNSGNDILLLERDLLNAFEWFMKTYQEAPGSMRSSNVWELLRWDPRRGNLNEFHSWLFKEVVERRDHLIKDKRSRYCIVVAPIYSPDDFDPSGFGDFQRKNFGPGFKSLLAFDKPANFRHPNFRDDCCGVLIGDMFFVGMAYDTYNLGWEENEVAHGPRPLVHR